MSCRSTNPVPLTKIASEFVPNSVSVLALMWPLYHSPVASWARSTSRYISGILWGVSGCFLSSGKLAAIVTWRMVTSCHVSYDVRMWWRENS